MSERPSLAANRGYFESTVAGGLYGSDSHSCGGADWVLRGPQQLLCAQKSGSVWHKEVPQLIGAYRQRSSECLGGDGISESPACRLLYAFKPQTKWGLK